MPAVVSGQADLRAEHISKIVTGFALQEFKLKQLCLVSSSNSWKETFWKETKTDLVSGVTTGITSNAVKGVPRLAAFPYGEVSWTESSSRLEKFAMEGLISWEDAKTNEIDIIARTLLRIGRAIAKAVDVHIWDVISVTQAFTGCNSVTIAAGNEWDSATIANRDPIQDILNARKEIETDNYDVDKNGYLLVNPKDFANLMGNPNVRNAGQFWTSDVTKNGKVGRILGLTIIKSNAITADYAAVVIAKDCANYKVASPLKVETIYDSGIKYTIRAWEVGVCQLTNPEAVCGIINTQAA